MGKLAIGGGKPVRSKPFGPWPVYTRREERGPLQVLSSRNWGGYVFDSFNHEAQRVARGGTFVTQLGPDGIGYYIVAPVSESGIAFFGDSGKFVTMGEREDRLPC